MALNVGAGGSQPSGEDAGLVDSRTLPRGALRLSECNLQTTKEPTSQAGNAACHTQITVAEVVGRWDMLHLPAKPLERRKAMALQRHPLGLSRMAAAP